MGTIPLPSDFSEFLKLLNKNEVRYLLVGGYAVGYHGHVRGTADMDIWIDRADDNPQRVVAALAEFGFAGPDVTADVFREPSRVIRMGRPPLSIVLLTSVSGVDLADCFAEREVVKWDNVAVNVISLPMLKSNKHATGRLKDLDDLDHLG